MTQANLSNKLKHTPHIAGTHKINAIERQQKLRTVALKTINIDLSVVRD